MEELLLDDLRLRKVPLVFVDVGRDAPHVSNIRINYQHGIRQAVQHVAALRHTRIAFVSGPLYLPSALARKRAFEESMAEIGLSIDPEVLVEQDHTMEGGMRAFRKLITLRDRPTAVLCSNDMTAIGVMREAYDQGVSVPHELSVVGFDNIRLSEFMIPPLTTIDMSQTELARIAFKALVSDISRQTAAEKGAEYLLNTNLVLRRSTALAPSAQPRSKTNKK
jgi:DNA-binding LacI/PurR family transcriptional regulator